MPNGCNSGAHQLCGWCSQHQCCMGPCGLVFFGRGPTDRVQISIYEGFYQVWAAVVVPLGLNRNWLDELPRGQTANFQGLPPPEPPRLRL